jgi:hypothetical protein
VIISSPLDAVGDYGLDPTRTHCNISLTEFPRNSTGKFIKELATTIKDVGGWYDNSDTMTDYFDVAFYIDITFGRYDKPYVMGVKNDIYRNCDI